MKKEVKVLWHGHFGDEKQALLIDGKEIETVALVNHDEMFKIHHVDMDEKELNKRLKQYVEENEEKDEAFDFDYNSQEDIQTFLVSIGFADAEVKWCDEYPDIEEQLVYDSYNRMFSNLTYCDELKIYRYHDGSNWQVVELREDMSETVLEVTEDYVNLDEWDGRNHTTGGIGEHQYIFKVIIEDGEEAEDTFLLKSWSQWQGSHPTGQLFDSIEAVKDHIEELGDRNIEEYMYEIGKLSGK
ncbi:hypothetical protein [Bacillus pseudomycoides]|uniref:hypothetical protein n=1 Tax=Bacillus pseudomycoides TaxID=64104 RepID=UPI000BF1CF08|nr:hypothetical protein [Bacillus pseudomycoides]PEK34098.1 hypothetical protein CN691_12835 [Bacillus pseudomycoides]